MARPRPRSRLSALIAAALAACAFAATVSPAPASAENQPNAKLDAVATYAAGHRSTVWCETSWPAWLATVAREDPSSGEVAAEGVNGFTVIEKPVVYVSPRQCETLSAAIEFGHRQVGSYYLASAMLTLVHEAVHQRGVLDEGVADCTALALLPRVATRFFGYHARSRVIVRAQGRLVRRTVADPALADLLRFASAWHRSKPAAYQGRC